MHLFLYIFILLLLPTFAFTSDFNIRSFGTLGGIYNDNDNYIYRKNTLQKDGSSKDVSLKTDTLLGLQASYYFSNNYSVILQGIVEQDHHDETRAKIDWGYLKYDSQENFIFKVGRIRTPYYKNSDNLNIGYSNLMIRPPIEVYGQVPFSSYYGIEAIYSNIIDKYFYTIQFNYGKEEFTAPIHSLNQEVEVELDNLYALNCTFGTNEIQFRATYLNADISASSNLLDQLFSSLRKNNFNELADKYDIVDKNSQYYGIGLFVDYDGFILSSEYGKREIPSFYGDISGYYFTLGYNYKDITPYISYSKSKMEQDTYDPSIPSVFNDLNLLLQAQNIAQSTNTLGFKYFINENFDLKFQYEHVSPEGQNGSFSINSMAEPETLNVYSFAIDFIY